MNQLLTLDEAVKGMTEAIVESTKGMSDREFKAFLWELHGQLGQFPPEPNPYLDKP